ncbi:MAG: glycosyl transferase [Prevotella sp.]|nr:glycosyl transferase [Prevotella sp.]
MPDKEYLDRFFYARMGYHMDFENPRTFNEKLQWLKLYDRNPLYTRLVDKYNVKEYVSQVIGKEYIIPTLGIWTKFDDIDFDSLPEQFVLKCTHDSGGVIICTNKADLDMASVRKRINRSMKRDYFLYAREWPYKDVKHAIIAEELIRDNALPDNHILNDYKLHCFYGKFDCAFVCEGRFSSRGVRYHYFDKDWTYLPYCPYEGLNTEELNRLKPQNYGLMISLAEKLSAGIPEVRVDFYEVNGNILFGEMTFFSQMGFDTTITREADEILGSKLILPKL